MKSTCRHALKISCRTLLVWTLALLTVCALTACHSSPEADKSAAIYQAITPDQPATAISDAAHQTAASVRTTTPENRVQASEISEAILENESQKPMPEPELEALDAPETDIPAEAPVPAEEPSAAPAADYVIAGSDFLITVPGSWQNKILVSPTDSGLIVYYAAGRTPDAANQGIYETIFKISRLNPEEDLDTISSHSDRFDILGERGGYTYVLTQRSDTAIDFYDSSYWADIMEMKSAGALSGIEATFTFN